MWELLKDQDIFRLVTGRRGVSHGDIERLEDSLGSQIPKAMPSAEQQGTLFTQ